MAAGTGSCCCGDEVPPNQSSSSSKFIPYPACSGCPQFPQSLTFTYSGMNWTSGSHVLSLVSITPFFGQYDGLYVKECFNEEAFPNACASSPVCYPDGVQCKTQFRRCSAKVSACTFFYPQGYNITCSCAFFADNCGQFSCYEGPIVGGNIPCSGGTISGGSGGFSWSITI